MLKKREKKSQKLSGKRKKVKNVIESIEKVKSRHNVIKIEEF